MALSDAAAREIAEVLRKHVDRETLAQIVDELLEIRGDKDFREIIERLVHALMRWLQPKHEEHCGAERDQRASRE
jgi:transposase